MISGCYMLSLPPVIHYAFFNNHTCFKPAKMLTLLIRQVTQKTTGSQVIEFPSGQCIWFCESLDTQVNEFVMQLESFQ